MFFLLVLVFVSVFVVLALVLVASGAGASDPAKQTLAHLESALATSGRRHSSDDQIVDIRKRELLSAVPLLNRLLLNVEIAPQLRILLYQADLRWTAGGLLLMSLTAFVLVGYLIYLRSAAPLFAIGIGLVAAAGPFVFVFQKRRKRFNQFEQGLPEALDLMVSALRAGHSLVAALRLVAQESPDPIGGEFRI